MNFKTLHIKTVQPERLLPAEQEIQTVKWKKTSTHLKIFIRTLSIAHAFPQLSQGQDFGQLVADFSFFAVLFLNLLLPPKNKQKEQTLWVPDWVSQKPQNELMTSEIFLKSYTCFCFFNEPITLKKYFTFFLSDFNRMDLPADLWHCTNNSWWCGTILFFFAGKSEEGLKLLFYFAFPQGSSPQSMV